MWCPKLGKMCQLLVFIGLLAKAAQAFVPAPIQWGGHSANGLVMAPAFSAFPNPGVVLPQKLTIRDPLGRISPAVIPYFSAKPDDTIAWEAMGACLEASGIKSGETVQVNHCNGGPAQKWKWMPWGQIQLAGTNQCLDVAGSEADLNGAPIELRECGNRLSESWEFRTLPVSRQGPSPFGAQPSPLRHVMLSFILLAVAFGLGAPLYFLQRKAREMALINGGAHLRVDESGVALTTPLAVHGGRMVPDMRPAVMTVSAQSSAVTLDDRKVRSEIDSDGDSPKIRIGVEKETRAGMTAATVLPIENQLQLPAFQESKFNLETILMPVALVTTLMMRTFALKTLSSDPSVNIVLGLRWGEELLGSVISPSVLKKGEETVEEEAPSGDVAHAPPLPTWFAWDLTQFAALLRVVVGVATIQALAVAPMPVFGVVCSLEPGIAFLILMAWDSFRGTDHASKTSLPQFGMQELGLMMLIGGAALSKFGDLETAGYVYGLCLLKAICSASEDVFQDEARIATGLSTAQFLPTLFKRVLPMSAIAMLLFEVLPALQNGQTLFPSDPSAVIILCALAQPIAGWVTQLFWFETNRVSGDPVITMSLQPPKDALTSFFIPGSFAHMSGVGLSGYLLNLLGVGVYAANSARGKQRREEAEAASEATNAR